jgi:BirA family biotin operon repressor/biotin-[acetyl-CoA-carboxylase] ligase
MPFPEPRETWHFDTERIGRRVFVFDSVDSTNTLAAHFIKLEPDCDGVVILADHQHSGRGQYGRVWTSRAGSSLLMSVIVRPPLELCRPVILTAWVAVAVADAIYSLTSTQSRIKWPNDLLIRGKKVCGILIEQTSAGEEITTVAGVGLNLTQTADEFAAANLPDATSLGIVSGGHCDNRTAASIAIRKLDREYARLLAGERVAVEADWKWRIGLLGHQVRVEFTNGRTECGRLRDMGFDGLELEDHEGVVRAVPAESVAHICTV